MDQCCHLHSSKIQECWQKIINAVNKWKKSYTWYLRWLQKKIGPWISCTSKKLKEVRIMLFTCSLTEPEWEEFRWTIVQWPHNSSHGTAGSIGDVNVPRVTSTSPKLLLLLSLPYLFWPYDLYLTVIYVRIFKIWNFSLQVHGKYFWYLVYRCSFSGSTKNIILAHWW